MSFDVLSDHQRAVVSEVQLTLSRLNSALARAADAGVVIEIQVLDVSTMGQSAAQRRISATAGLPPTAIV